MTATDCPPPCLHPQDIISAQQVREYAGISQRSTLIRWRKERGFPEPITSVPGPGGPVELWDAREVRAWLLRGTDG
jgi:predicted DNA-binding transcriptional regulator AlpA